MVDYHTFKRTLTQVKQIENFQEIYKALQTSSPTIKIPARDADAVHLVKLWKSYPRVLVEEYAEKVWKYRLFSEFRSDQNFPYGDFWVGQFFLDIEQKPHLWPSEDVPTLSELIERTIPLWCEFQGTESSLLKGSPIIREKEEQLFYRWCYGIPGQEPDYDLELTLRKICRYRLKEGEGDRELWSKNGLTEETLRLVLEWRRGDPMTFDEETEAQKNYSKFMETIIEILILDHANKKTLKELLEAPDALELTRNWKANQELWEDLLKKMKETGFGFLGPDF